MAGPLAEFEHAGIRVAGFSFAGEESFFVLPELNIAFDVGCAPRDLIAIDHVFLSHGHMDHSAGLAYYFGQRMFLDNSPGNLYVPKGLREPVQRLLRAWADVDGHEPPANLHEVTPGVDVPVRRDLLVRPFEVNHPCRRQDRAVIPSLGFSVIEVRNKLRDEFQGLTGPELVALKKQGTEITRRIELPLVTYCGDTGPGAFFELPHVRDATILLLECTFLEPDHMGRARAGGHMHISDLKHVVPQLKNERILLTHLSRRNSLSDAKAGLRAALGAEASERVSFFMEHRRRRRPDEAKSKPVRPPS